MTPQPRPLHHSREDWKTKSQPDLPPSRKPALAAIGRSTGPVEPRRAPTRRGGSTDGERRSGSQPRRGPARLIESSGRRDGRGDGCEAQMGSWHASRLSTALMRSGAGSTTVYWFRLEPDRGFRIKGFCDQECPNSQSLWTYSRLPSLAQPSSCAASLSCWPRRRSTARKAHGRSGSAVRSPQSFSN